MDGIKGWDRLEMQMSEHVSVCKILHDKKKEERGGNKHTWENNSIVG